MMTDKELIQQTLNTLENLFWKAEHPGGVAVWRLGGSYAVKEAIDALKARLEQPVVAPAWVGLTPEDYDSMRPRVPYIVNDFSFADVAVIVEAKLKEKNT
jgi:hypothetical protein